MPDSKGHYLLTKASIEILPKWQQKVFEKEKKDLLSIYCMYGDSYFGDRKEEARPYMEMPDGGIPMVPWQFRLFKKIAPGKDFFICGYYKLARYVFGLGAPFQIDYLIPEGVYKKFISFVGLHSDLGKGGEIIFKVAIDEKIVFNSGVLKDDKARKIEIPLRKGEKLSLITQPSKESFGKFENQGVWAEPILCK